MTYKIRQNPIYSGMVSITNSDMTDYRMYRATEEILAHLDNKDEIFVDGYFNSNGHFIFNNLSEKGW